MKEHQERVNKIPGAPKLLPKRDMGRFVEQLYSEGAAPHFIPKTFKMLLYLKIYDGTTDPEDHLIHYVTAVKEIVYTLEKLGTKVQWPQKMKSNPSTRRSNVLCEFHQERGHKTEDCIGLRQEVVRMLNQLYLKELLSDKGRANFARGRDPSQGPPKPPSPARTIQMTIGGGDDMVINHVKFTTTHKLKQIVAHERYDDLEDNIIFDKLDTDGLSFPHYDALVITLRIADTYVKRIMVDDGSGACIVHPRVLMQMRLEDKIILCYITLTGFNNALERTSGEIVLPVLAGGVFLETTFRIMNQETAYNAIIGRPWMHAMLAVPSSFYQVIKFPTAWGIFSIRGEPRTAQECYGSSKIAHTQNS
uniref:Retrotransposon gag domain-containing protein n=1 Tax=Nicotiana tabacum TaxID=4097 RepID=A0A1S4DJL3_TOBAC|nr:PREDICTED: uncharacterized protein LOC107830499 [Nicotiana tabacum]